MSKASKCHILRKERKMKMNKINGIEQPVSEVCLGTMTFGEQNSEIESHEIMDVAFERGINFFDTAEMYPIPPKGDTFNRTEEIIGRWDKFHLNREKIVMATKVIGTSSMMKWIRNGSPRLDRKNIFEAIDGSLKRLKTDYIDLYQIHWHKIDKLFWPIKFYRAQKRINNSDQRDSRGVKRINFTKKN